MKKIVHYFINTLRVMFWIAIATIAIPYFLLTASAGTPVLVANNTEVSTLPFSELGKDNVYKGTVVEALDNSSSAESKKYRIIRTWSTVQGYCRTSDLIDLSMTSYDDIDNNYVVVLNSEKIKPQENVAGVSDEKIVTTCKDLLSFSKKCPFSGIYLVVSPDTDWAFYADYFEQLHIPYGYILKTSEFDSLKDAYMFFTSNVPYNDLDEQYNILPIVFDTRNISVSPKSVDKLIGDDYVIMDDTKQPHDCETEVWNTESQEFASPREYAREVKTKIETKNAELEYVELNTESYYASNFARECSTLTDK